MSAPSLEERKMKFTPGPWVINDEGKEVIITGGPDDKYICDVTIHQMPRKIGLYEEKQRIANAKLIAAAPELLKYGQMVLDEFTYAGEIPPALAEVLNKLQDTIKKATE